MPLPVKNALNNVFLSKAPNKWDVFPRPNRLINYLIPHNQLPFNLLVYDVSCHSSLVSLELACYLSGDAASPHRHPIPHRSHKGDKLVLEGHLPEILCNKPMILLDEEGFTRGNANRHPWRPYLPRVVRYQSLNQLPWHKAEDKG